MKNQNRVSWPIVIGLAGVLLAACSPKNATDSTSTNRVSADPAYSLSDISQHGTPQDCWMAIDGKVYNVTDFIALGIHNPKINDGCGVDASQMFSAVEKHAEPTAQSQLSKYFIGNLK